MANTLKFCAIVRDNVLPLPDMSAFDGKRVAVTIVEVESVQEGALPPRRFGTLAGQFVVPDNFDAPLSELSCDAPTASAPHLPGDGV